MTKVQRKVIEKIREALATASDDLRDMIHDIAMTYDERNCLEDTREYVDNAYQRLSERF